MPKSNFFFTRLRRSKSLRSQDRNGGNTNRETVIFAEILSQNEYLVSLTNIMEKKYEHLSSQLSQINYRL